jgi:hypothetical protein
MFLNELDQNEKVAFLKIAHYAARSDGDFSDDQKNIINTYCFEMQISDIDYDHNSFNLSEILKGITNERSQKIILLELMALILSDDIVHKEEKKVIDLMLNTFSIKEELYYIYLEWTKAILAVSEHGKLLISL